MNLQNLIDYYEWQGINVFEGCTVPAPFNINMVINEIMKRCGLLTPIYSDPDVFKTLTKMWFDSNQWNFEHLAKVFNAEYSPIENVYESDHWTEKNTGTDKRAFGGSDTDTLSGEDVDTLSGTDTTKHGKVDTLSGSDTETDSTSNEHTVSAYNSGGYQADSKDQRGGNIQTQYGKKNTESGKTELDYGKKDTMKYGKKDTLVYGKTDDFTHGHDITYDRLRHGNIGVTTNNQLINEELSMLEKFNPYDWIAAKFERENFLQLY